MMSTLDLLNKLADIKAQLELLCLDKETAINEALSPEVRQALADIEAEYSQKAEAAQANATELEELIKSQVVAQGKTVKGERLQAVYMNPRVTWDSKALDGYSMNHPELFVFRKEGEAGCQIRVVK